MRARNAAISPADAVSNDGSNLASATVSPRTGTLG